MRPATASGSATSAAAGLPPRTTCPGVANAGLADVVAVCDLDAMRVTGGKATVEKLFASRAGPKPGIEMYHDYRELLARKDIDAVTISTPDHWHAQLAIAAVHAGKDVYLQKPMTMTHAEGVALRDAVAKSGRILQVGSQQRSWGPNEQFRKAVECVRSGRVGRLLRVEIGLPIDPTKPDDPQQPVPPNLDYNAWLAGPTPEVYYTEQRVHSQTSVSTRPGWLRHDAYCLRDDHRMGRASFRCRALGHEPGTRRADENRGPGRIPDQQDLERARRLSGWS